MCFDLPLFTYTIKQPEPFKSIYRSLFWEFGALRVNICISLNSLFNCEIFCLGIEFLFNTCCVQSGVSEICVWQPSLEEVSLDYSNHPNVRMNECRGGVYSAAAHFSSTWHKAHALFHALSLSVSFSPFYLSKNRPAWGRQLTLACSHELTLMQGVLKDWKINSTQWCSKAVEPSFPSVEHQLFHKTIFSKKIQKHHTSMIYKGLCAVFQDFWIHTLVWGKDQNRSCCSLKILTSTLAQLAVF